MAEPKVQLVAPIGNLTVPGMNVTGVVTATTIGANVGVAASIIQGSNLDIGAGIITATSFVGDQIGTYRAASLTGSPDLVVGVVTSSGFVAQITGDVTGNLTGNVVGTAKSILSGNNLWVGIATATLVGPASNLVGVAASSFTHQTVTANSGTTAIDLSVGNIITFNQSSNTTVSFANTSSAMSITLIRVKDISSTARTITWPDSISWDGGSAPTLITDSSAGDSQQFQLLTRDSGLTWYGWEPYKFDGPLGELWAWGKNLLGPLGQNDIVERSSPTQIPGTKWTASGTTAGFGQAAFGRKNDGTLWTWGDNEKGNLGHNDENERSSPTQVPGTTWSNMVSMGNEFPVGSAAVKTDGTLWTWGSNYRGVLGHNQAPVPLPGLSSPTQLPGTTWSTDPDTLGKGDNRMSAIKTDGTLWYWGYGGYGAMGNNQPDATYFSSPAQIGGTTWKNISVGRYVTVATKTDNTLWAWGYGGYGSLGQNSTSTPGYSSPIQIPGTTWATGESKISHGNNSLMAIKTDGTLWASGWNLQGVLGLNQAGGTTNSRSSPTQVGTETTWDAVSSSYHKALALKTDGTLWAWGKNDKGQIGNNNVASYSSPVQIPGTDWIKIGAAQYSSYAIKTP